MMLGSWDHEQTVLALNNGQRALKALMFIKLALLELLSTNALNK